MESISNNGYCANCGQDKYSLNPLCAKCSAFLENYDKLGACPHGNNECIPTERQWQCDECALDKRYGYNQPQTLATGTRLFVYGTLLKWSTNGSMIDNDLRRIPAKVQGRLHYYSRYRNFPVLIPDVTQWTIGEVIEGKSFDDFSVAYAMEIAVGYDARHATAYPLDDGAPQEVVLFSWPWSDYAEQVPRNDWANRFKAR